MKHLQSLRSRLLLTVGVLTLLGCGLITLLVSGRYSQSLEDALEAQGSTLAQSLAVQLSDLVLVNDVTSIQKLLDSLVEQHKLSYAFVERSGRVPAHTFVGGLPADLLNFNHPKNMNGVASCGVKPFRFSDGDEVLLDVACPIYEGKAGTVHIGVSENAARDRLVRLWAETALAAIIVLLLMLSGVFWLLKRLTRPLETLADVTRRVGGGGKEAELLATLQHITGQREIVNLADSFRDMLERLEENRRKEARSREQLATCNAIITGVAGRRNLQDMGRFLLSSCRSVLRCADVVLLFFAGRDESVLSISVEGTEQFSDGEFLHQAMQAAEVAEGGAAVTLFAPLVPERFASYASQVHIPIQYEGKLCGLFVSGCAPGCRCDKSEIALIGLILGQTAGCLYRALEYEDAVKKLKERFEHSDDFHGIIGRDGKMQLLYKRMEDVASSDASVLIQGESGTGKELVARAVHALSPRRNRPFIVINCAVYQDTLLESELFGHEKGAFTGADRQRAGRFEQAEGGTVFLDEIGEISASAQVKLLRVLQEKVIERVGGNTPVPVNVRVIAATNRVLSDAVKTGHFREDLYYRLDVVSLFVPPLRGRTGDIPLLTRHFLARFATEYKKELTISRPAMQILLQYPWPGNVRELENCLAQAALLAPDGAVTPEELPERVTGLAPAAGLEQNEREVIRKTLAQTQGNKKLTAAQLGISRTTLYAKMKKYSLIEP